MIKNSRCNAGDVDSIPGPGTKIRHAVEQLSPHTRITELQLESPCTAAKGPT